MTPDEIELSEDVVVIGIALRTSAATAMADIPGFWGRFMREDVAARLPRRGDDASTYAVYCDYESDASGPYTMVLGVAAPDGAPVPDGMRRVRLPRGRYARFVAEGDPAQVVWRTWAEVNERWEGRTRRRYIADCERYASEGPAPGQVRVEILVGVV